MKRFSVLFVGLLVVLPSPTMAASYERVLIPVLVASTPGAEGSVWLSELWVHNADQVVHDFDANESCIAQCVPRELRPAESRQVPFIGQQADNPGLIAFVEQPADVITFNLRVQDTSRQADTWGTELPVIRESETIGNKAQLLNVPVEPQFRDMLRIYSIDGATDARVRVRAFDLVNGATLGLFDVPLRAPIGSINTPSRYKPYYAAISDLSVAFPGIGGASRVGLELIPLTPGLRFWAFVSVTHNQTQHVTTISPQ